jgi:hypothetical protein
LAAADVFHDELAIGIRNCAVGPFEVL